MLVKFGGLPGTGKTTLGKALAAQHAAVYVRVDEIETALALNTDFGPDIGPAGYIVAFAIARSNLALGNFVVADSVNLVLESRSGWRTVRRIAAQAVLRSKSSAATRESIGGV